MALYLVQHGKALSKDQDPEQGLSPDGVADVTRIARVAAGYEVRVRRIEHSVKKRARQTAELYADHLQPPGGAHQRQGLKAMDDVAAVAADLDPGADVMLVGHLPFMERLTGLLVAGDADLRVFRFQNGGLVCLDAEGADWFVSWALQPHVG